MRRIATAALVGACVVGVAACGSNSNRSNLKTQLDRHNRELNTGDGTTNPDVIGGAGQLPKGFPSSDVPLPSNNTKDIVGSGNTATNGLQTWLVQYEVSGGGATAYAAKLEAAGFKSVSTYPSPENGANGIYRYQNAKYAVSVTDANNSPPTLVITVGPNSATTASTPST